MRNLLWEIANKLADKEVDERCIMITNFAQALDWVLGLKSPLEAFEK